MHSHGVIGCFSPAQHAAAANHQYAGRTDLVLLLIDTDRLQSEVRVEQSDAHGQPVPCVYGPVNLDAVFEATPYRPGADGRFHPHEEASGFAVHGTATLDQTRRRAVEVMAGYRRPWWVAGGWALDLVLGHKTRPHADLEISMLACDQQSLFDHLRGWVLRLAAPGQSLPRWDAAGSSRPSTRSGRAAVPAGPRPPSSSPPTPRCSGSSWSRAGRTVGSSGATLASVGCWTRSAGPPRRHHPRGLRATGVRPAIRRG